MIDLALVTARCAQALDEDLPPLLAAADRAGLSVQAWAWDDPACDWSQCRVALLRSPWDYTERYPEFLAWLARVEPQTRLFNPPSLLRWNTDKRYLADLQQAGVAIVPTEFLAPGIDVEVPWLGGGTTVTTGNSFAAPHIAGRAALIKSKHPELRPFQIKTVLWATAANVREAGRPEVAGRLSQLMSGVVPRAATRSMVVRPGV